MKAMGNSMLGIAGCMAGIGMLWAQVGVAQIPLFQSIDPSLEGSRSTNLDSDSLAYILGIGDQLQITVFGYAELTGTQPILPDGSIILPLLGTVRAAGRTPAQLSQELTTRLRLFLTDPVVTVIPTQLRPILVTVAGEVLRPGPIQAAALQGTPTLSTALLAAGGITAQADIRRVVVHRRQPDGTEISIPINLWNAIASEDPPSDLRLQDGDGIYIPRLTADASLDRRLLARSSLAPATVRARVVGEVVNPGEVQVPPNSSLSSAVAIAGGPTRDARLQEVVFVRLNESGQIERQTVDLRDLIDPYQIQDGDVILVPKRGSRSLLDLAVRATPPLNLLINLLNAITGN